MKSRLDGLDLELLPRSRTTDAGAEWALARDGNRLQLVVAVPEDRSALLEDLEGRTES